jgi:hypothetical protein
VRCVTHAALDDTLASLAANPEPIDDTQLDIQRMAFAILDEAEDAIGVKSLARERASCGEWPIPQTPGEFLFWIEDEAVHQEDMTEVEAELLEGNETRLQTHTQALREVADRLRDLGFTPAPAPWLAIA